MDHLDDGKVWVEDSKTGEKRRVDPRVAEEHKNLTVVSPVRDVSLREPVPNNDQCAATTLSGTRCKRPTDKESSTCTVHQEPEPGNVETTDTASEPVTNEGEEDA